MAAVLLWTLAPLVAIHLWMLRSRRHLRFQLLLDLALAILLGPAVVRGLDLNPVRCVQDRPPYTGWSWQPETELQSTQSDLVLQLHPWWEEARRQLVSGRLPLISPCASPGAPLLGSGQVGLWAPVMAPVWVLGPERGTTVMAVWKLELAALGAYLLLASGWRFRPSAAIVGGLAWGLSPCVLGWLLSPLAWSLAALPWGWLLALHLGRCRASWWTVGAAGAALGWFLGCGLNPSSAAVVVGSVLLAALVFHPGRWPRVVAVAAIAALVGGVMAWPSLRTIGASSKMAAYRQANPNLERLPSEVRNAALRQLVTPAGNGHPGRGTWSAPYPAAAGAAGIGGAALALLVAGSVRRRHRRLVVAAAAGLAVAAVLAYRVPPLDALLVRIPPLDRMTLPRFALLVPWGLGLWAAAAFEGAGQVRRRAAWVLPVLLALVAVSGPHEGWTAGDWLLALSTPLCATVVLVLSARLRWACVALVLAELAVLGLGVNPSASPADRLPEPPVLQRLVAAVSDGERVLALDGALPANLTARYGLADLRSFGPIRPWPLARLHRLLGADDPVLPGPPSKAPPRLCGAWSVRYLVTPEGSEAPGWEPFDRGDGVRVWSNPQWQPQVRLVARVAAMTEHEAWQFLASEPEILLSGAVVPAATAAVAAEATELELLTDSPAVLTARVRCDGPCLLVAARAWAPGWTATVDGERAALVRANMAGLGVVAPKGEHEVELRYRPWSWE